MTEVQNQELLALRNQLQEEQEVLFTYQARQQAHLKGHIDKELKDLEDRVALRKALLEERVFTFVFLSLYDHASSLIVTPDFRIDLLCLKTKVLKS